ncbi:membrane-associated oxidoreductase [Pseudomonas floridensis]|uniref:membrane-associated oxidoreductase n=1 Tax=Pseudomonas floridensis TaxID=1958950 RepID=UPI001FC8FFBD|nr:membrane-associated oxidoreductase [Pseudomonas floridensis]
MKAQGRSLTDFKNLYAAEKTLLECCRSGAVAKISPTKPDVATEANRVRAYFLRFLALGGDESAPVHERGIRLEGAYVEGYLNLSSARVPVPLTLRNCVVEKRIMLTDADLAHTFAAVNSTINGLDASRVRIAGLMTLKDTVSSSRINIDGAHVQGQINCSGAHFNGEESWALSAENTVCGGNFQLSNEFEALGGVNLMAARIEGQLGCKNSRFIKTQRFAFQADRIHVKGSVFLGEGFSSVGTVRFPGAKVHGQFNCNGGHFDGQGGEALSLQASFISGSLFLGSAFKAQGNVSLQGMQLKGDLILRGAQSLTGLLAKRVAIEGALVLRSLVEPLKAVSFAGGRCESLDDDRHSWGDQSNLDGFRYRFIHVHSAMSISDRLNWLGNEKLATSVKGQAVQFRPQPWRHLQGILEEMGHAEEARQVGVEFEKCLRVAGLIGQSPEHWCEARRFFYKKLMTFLHVMYGLLTGYGYRPMLLLRSFLFVWLLCSGIYWWAANEGAIFAPSDPLVFQNEKYASCLPPMPPTEHQPAGTGNWYLCAALPEAYTGFSPLAFSLDLLLPLVDLHQEKDWAPLIETPKANVFAELWSFFSFKRLVRFVMWVEILAGWGFSLLFVAVVSGLTRRKE